MAIEEITGRRRTDNFRTIPRNGQKSGNFFTTIIIVCLCTTAGFAAGYVFHSNHVTPAQSHLIASLSAAFTPQKQPVYSTIKPEQPSAFPDKSQTIETNENENSNVLENEPPTAESPEQSPAHAIIAEQLDEVAEAQTAKQADDLPKIENQEISIDVDTNNQLDNDIPAPVVNTGGLGNGETAAPTSSNGLPLDEPEGKGDLQTEPPVEDEDTNGITAEEIDTNAVPSEDNDGDGVPDEFDLCPGSDPSLPVNDDGCVTDYQELAPPAETPKTVAPCGSVSMISWLTLALGFFALKCGIAKSPSRVR